MTLPELSVKVWALWCLLALVLGFGWSLGCWLAGRLTRPRKAGE